MDRHFRNLHPHGEARIAMIIWGDRYAAQTGGSMDFYDSLSNGEKATCRSALDAVLSAIELNGRAPIQKDTAQ